MPNNHPSDPTSSPSSQHSDVLSFEMDENSVRDDVLRDSLLTSDAGSSSEPDHSPLSTPPRPPRPRHSPSWTHRYLYRESSQAGKTRVCDTPVDHNHKNQPVDPAQSPYLALPVTPEEAERTPSVPVVAWTLPEPATGLGATRYLRKAVWLLLLVATYASTRAAVWLGIPADGNRDLDPYDLQDDISKLLLYGFVLGWFARVTESDRFPWLFSWPRWWFSVVLVGTPPVYGLISDIPGLQHSFADIKHWGVAQWVVVVAGLGALVALTAYHIVLARARMAQAEMAAYILSRCAVYMLFASMTAMTVGQDHYKLHLHHLYLGWAFGLFAEFNTPLSATTLAVTTGIFVQGIGAYSFAANLYNPNCFKLPFGAAQTMTCQLSVPSSNVTIQVCPTQPAVHVNAHCTVPAGR